MIKKTVTYVDYNGKEQTEDLYFNMDEAEVIDWVGETNGGIIWMIAEIMKLEDPIKILPMVKEMMLKSYGVKSPDGKSFIKSEEVLQNFRYSKAFHEIRTELSTSSDALVEFINGILPSKYSNPDLTNDEIIAKLDEIDDSIIPEETKAVLREKYKEA